ncbi:MAG: peptide chain release factor 1 [Candidatus Omnitrophica bacterium]|nr:peptide chain release factor 1 [Candidatus Omnitrophota bacterium]
MFERLEKIEKRHDELEQMLSDGEVVKNQNKFQALAKEFAGIAALIKQLRIYKSNEEELSKAQQLLEEEKNDKELIAFYNEEVKQCKEKKEALRLKLEDLLLEDDDADKNKNIIVEIRAGTGGEEAALFASELFRMYCKYASSKGLRIDVMNTNPTGIGGLKEIIFGITGVQAYRYFRFESGTHRVQRVPKTEGCGRIHTSAVTVAVLPEAEEVEVAINVNDLRIDVYRSSGPGGQSVNTTDSAVRITHIPTGLVVTCQDEKSQHKNKAKAMRVLRARLFDKIQQEQAKEIAADRKKQIGTGDRSGRIRTYNFPDRRVTDHRINITLYSLERIMEGDLDELFSALEIDYRGKKLTGTLKA